MTKNEMIQELIEHELQTVPALDLIHMFIQLTGTMMADQYDEDEILEQYTKVFGDKEVKH